ncbi:MAG: hypothetical protein KatS3mg060_1855 [Dehalococcoidia bacterium]|nr:MAG: hypothetical protein KatS3mg060_1855 [Dehalococcoidia bacterium]
MLLTSPIRSLKLEKKLVTIVNLADITAAPLKSGLLSRSRPSLAGFAIEVYEALCEETVKLRQRV